MDVLRMKRGDTAPRFRARLLDGTDPVSLSSASQVLLLMRRSGGPLLSLPLEVEDQTTNPGWVNRAWATADTAVAGAYSAEVEVTWADQTVQTFPASGHASIAIAEDID